MSTEAVNRKLFTSEEFQRMMDAGIFPPDARYELIRGEILEMPRSRGRHAGRVNKLTRLFTSTLGERVIVSVQNEVVIDNLTPPSCPRPDVALLKPMAEFFGPFAPEPHEVLLLIEISDSTIRYDKNTKGQLYAEAGIPEYWILNIPEGVLEVLTDPVDGSYRKTQVLKPGEMVSPSQLPDVAFAVGDILG